jgi:transposase
VTRRNPWEVEDGLGEQIERLLPKVERRFQHPRRQRLDDRKALCGILVASVADHAGSNS